MVKEQDAKMDRIIELLEEKKKDEMANISRTASNNSNLSAAESPKSEEEEEISVDSILSLNNLLHRYLISKINLSEEECETAEKWVNQKFSNKIFKNLTQIS